MVLVETSQNSPELRTERESSIVKVTQQAGSKAKVTKNLETKARSLFTQETLPGVQMLIFQGCFVPPPSPLMSGLKA